MSSSHFPSDFKRLLGLHPSSPHLLHYISSLATSVSVPPVSPQVKSYPDAVYLSYYALGISFLFNPLTGYKPAKGADLGDLNNDKLILDSVYIYNTPPPLPDSNPSTPSTLASELAFSPFPSSFRLDVGGEFKDQEGEYHKRPGYLDVKRGTTGKEFVSCLGEPDRKGGGTGPSSGSIGIWCEWTKDGLMVEFGGDEARGLQAWERGKDAVWKVITLFSPQPS